MRFPLVKIVILGLSLIVFSDYCQASQRLEEAANLSTPFSEESLAVAAGERKPRQGPEAKINASWQGRHIGQLIASWGKPAKIRPASDEPGYYDYIFESYGRHATGASPYAFNSQVFFCGFNLRNAAWSQDPFDRYDNFYQLECRAVVRVDASRLIRWLRFESNILCLRYSPFGLAPPEIP
jgi:hypothetical protein